jgi:cytosine/adenosine deaminase-related metal-dependent hydrolase
MGSLASTVAYRARWVFPVSQPPIANGVVTVRHEARGATIVAVGERGEVGLETIDLGEVAIVPGLINAHTHLEFSLFDRPFGEPGLSFPAWLRQVVRWRREQPAVMGQEGLELAEGRQQTHAAGVVAIGEIATPTFAEQWNEEPARQAGNVFLELLSLNPDRVEPLARQAENFAHAGSLPCGAQRGLSPHAPYTVHPRLLEIAVQLSAERRLPLTMHLAESREELELLHSQSGALVDLLRELCAWYPDALTRGLKPLDYLQTLAKAHRVLVAHGNFLTAAEMEFAAQQRHLTIVYCPRTQAYFDHDPYPLGQMLTAGVRVAVGTDSRASNPDLSIWRELKFVRDQHPAVAPAQVLELGTMNGAQALGIDHQWGTLQPGKQGGFTTIAIDVAASDPYEALFAEEQVYSSDLSNRMLID